MLIDVSIVYQEPNLIVSSKAANYTDIRPSKIALSKTQDEDSEQIEGVGEDWSTEDLRQMALEDRGQDNRVYRVINPFNISSFEPVSAVQSLNFYCMKSYLLAHPRTYELRKFFMLDKIDLKLKLPHYNLIAADKRMAFEKELRQITKRYQIEQ